MSHELDMSNNRVNFAYVEEHGSVWHGLGNVVKLNSDLDTWKKEAGLNWEVKKSEINYLNDLVVPDKKALYRSDNNKFLSIVSKSYKIVQPGEIVDFFDNLLTNNGMEMSSCGSLFGGKKYFATAKLNDYEIVEGDKINGYLLLATSVDGTFATTAKVTSVRTVCNNTLTMAMNENVKNCLKVNHNTFFDADKIKMDMGLVAKTQLNFIHNMKLLANTPCTPKQANDFYKEMFYDKNLKEQNGRIINKVSDIMDCYLYGNGSKLGQNTYYNILQGVTDYYSNSLSGRNESSNFWSSFYGKGDEVKSEIQNKLLEMV